MMNRRETLKSMVAAGIGVAGSGKASFERGERNRHPSVRQRRAPACDLSG